jgi:hypothetical protein
MNVKTIAKPTGNGENWRIHIGGIRHGVKVMDQALNVNWSWRKRFVRLRDGVSWTCRQIGV